MMTSISHTLGDNSEAVLREAWRHMVLIAYIPHFTHKLMCNSYAWAAFFTVHGHIHTFTVAEDIAFITPSPLSRKGTLDLA
jgi:hypothetical protein